MQVRLVIVIFCFLASPPTLGDQSEADARQSPSKQFDIGTRLEGVVFDDDGTGYVSAPADGEIYRFWRGQEAELWAKSERPNGHKILGDGNHVVADRIEHAIIKFDGSGRRIGSISSTNDVIVQAPNDITLDGRGGFYFTDTRGSWRGPPNGEIQHVDSTGKLRVVATGLHSPNGLVLSPNSTLLYVSESRSNRVLAFSVLESGLLDNERVLADLSNVGPADGSQVLDGMTVDGVGNVYVTYTSDRGVYVLSPEGEIIHRIDSGLAVVTNVAFEPGTELLFMVGSLDDERTVGSIFALDVSDLVGTRPSDHR